MTAQPHKCEGTKDPGDCRASRHSVLLLWSVNILLSKTLQQVDYNIWEYLVVESHEFREKQWLGATVYSNSDGKVVVSILFHYPSQLSM